MGCGPCYQVTTRKGNIPNEDNKSNNPQIQDFNDLTDAANINVKNFETPFHSDKKSIINNLENVNEKNINNDITNIGESQNPNIITDLPQANKDNTETMKNIYDSNNIQLNKFNNPNEIMNYLNKKDVSELVQSNNAYFNICSKTNIFDINKSKNYNNKTKNYINNFKGKNSTNPNANEEFYVINE